MFFLTVAEHIDHQCFKSSYYPSFDHLPFVPWLFPVYLASKNCGELSWQGGCEAGGPILSTIQSCLHFVTYNSSHIIRKASSVSVNHCLRGCLVQQFSAMHLLQQITALLHKSVNEGILQLLDSAFQQSGLVQMQQHIHLVQVLFLYTASSLYCVSTESQTHQLPQHQRQTASSSPPNSCLIVLMTFFLSLLFSVSLTCF